MEPLDSLELARRIVASGLSTGLGIRQYRIGQSCATRRELLGQNRRNLVLLAYAKPPGLSHEARVAGY
jgi:hypothetical protein